MTDPSIVSEPRGDSEDATFVRDGLALFNVAVTGDAYYSPLAIFLKDERGAVLGGPLGHVWGGWLDLDTLWVAEPFRGQGYGAKLLSAAEKTKPLPDPRRWDGPRFVASPRAPLAPRCPQRPRPGPPYSQDNRRLPSTAPCRRGRSP